MDPHPHRERVAPRALVRRHLQLEGDQRAAGHGASDADEERTIAPALYATLMASAERLRAGERDYTRLETEAKARLAAAGFRPDYVEVRRAHDLQPPTAQDRELRILAAAWLGRARLIDNLAVALA